MATPERRLPVCAGWMPLPNPGMLNSPLTTLIFGVIGSSGASDLLNVMPAPEPLDHQWLPLTPLPMKRTANRFGNAAPHAGSDSSHGSARATPAPRRTVLLDTPLIARPFVSFVAFVSFVPLSLRKKPHAHGSRCVREDRRRLQ